MAARTIPAVLQEAADRFGALEAVVDGERRMTFAGVLEAVDGIARALIGSGVRPGDRVAVWAPNGLDWVTISFAVYGVGAVLVPINTRYKGQEAAHLLETAGVTLLFTVTDFLGVDYLQLLGDRPPGGEATRDRRGQRSGRPRFRSVVGLCRAGARRLCRGCGGEGERCRGRQPERHHLYLGNDRPSQRGRAPPGRQRRDLPPMVSRGWIDPGGPHAGRLPLLPYRRPQVLHPRLLPGRLHARDPSGVRRRLRGRPGRRRAHHRPSRAALCVPVDPGAPGLRVVSPRDPPALGDGSCRRPGRADRRHA